MARMERVIKKLWVVVILLILLLVGSNACWIWYESQWETFDMEVTQENESGFNSFIGMDGDINIGDKALQADGSCEGPEA